MNETDIREIKKHVSNLGCKVVRETAFSLVSKCGDDAFIVKEPNSRIKVLVKSDMNAISDLIPLPKNINPSEVTVGRLQLQGTMSRLMKLMNLDEVEFVFGKEDIEKINLKSVTYPLSRINRANKFITMEVHEGIDPPNTIKREVGKISDVLIDQIEKKISTKVGDNVLCGSKSIINPSWSQDQGYQFLLKVRCKVPSILDPVNEKIGEIGSERMFSEADRFHVKSITPPSGDLFLSSLKLKSKHGDDHLEFELIDNNKIKKKNFLDNVRAIKAGEEGIPDDDEPVRVEDLLPSDGD